MNQLPPHYAAYLPQLKPLSGGAAVTRLTLPYPPSVNQLFAHVPSHHGGQIRVKTKLYKDWLQEAGIMLMGQRQSVQPHAGAVSITYVMTPPKDKRKRDLGNLEKAASDFLVEHHIIRDDSLIQDLQLTWDRSWPEVGVRVEIRDWLEAPIDCDGGSV